MAGRARLASWATLAAAAAYYVVFVARTAFTFQGRTYFALFDDSAISMQYARNFAHGHGLVWNAGEHVEGYSNLLWTFWMSLVHLVGVPDRYTGLVVMATGGALLIATLVVVRRLCDAIVPDAPYVGLVAMAMTALFYPLVFWALRGTEVAPAALLVTLAALLAVRLQAGWTPRRAWALGAVLAAAVLTRDDLVVPCVVVLAWLAWKGAPATRRRTLLPAAVMVAAIAAHEIFRLAYYGDALPNTYYLKLQGLGLGERLATGAEGLVYTALNGLPAVLVLGVVAVAVRRRSAAVPLLAALFAAVCAYSVYVGGDAWEDVRFANRFFATAGPVLMVLAAIGVYELRRREVAWRAAIAFALSGALLLALELANVVPHRRLGITDELAPQLAPPLLLFACAAALALVVVRPARPAAIAAAAAVALLGVAAGSADPTSDWVRSNAQDLPVEQVWTDLGVIVREHTAPGTRVAYVLAGNMSYFADRRGVDLLGKMDPVVARTGPTGIEPIRFRPGHNKWDYGHSIGELRPQVITSLWFPTASDRCDIRHWGYQELAGGLWVLRGSRGVDAAGLGAAIARLGGTRAAVRPESPC
jgi:arabinofuranosyltransferase